jgi:hypothetical protein
LQDENVIVRKDGLVWALEGGKWEAVKQPSSMEGLRSVVSGDSNYLVLGENSVFPSLQRVDKKFSLASQEVPVPHVHALRMQLYIYCLPYVLTPEPGCW